MSKDSFSIKEYMEKEFKEIKGTLDGFGRRIRGLEVTLYGAVIAVGFIMYVLDLSPNDVLSVLRASIVNLVT